jgi:hypothetical protein
VLAAVALAIVFGFAISYAAASFAKGRGAQVTEAR